MMMLTVNPDSLGNGLLILSIMFFLPIYLLLHLWKGLSFAELSAAALAMAYLIWRAVIRYWPGESPYYYWPVLRAIHDAYWHIGYRLGRRSTPIPMIDPESQRWNWSLLAVFYAAILIGALVRRRRPRPVRTCDSKSHSPRVATAPSAWRRILSLAEVVLPLWFLSYWHHTSCPLHSWPSGVGPFGWAWCRWVCLMGLAGSLLLSLLLNLMRFHRWCPRWYAVRLSLLVPPVAAGILAGVVSSLVGRGALLFVSVGVVILILLSSRYPSHRRGWLFASLLLAMFWGFALSSTKIIPLKIPWMIAM